MNVFCLGNSPSVLVVSVDHKTGPSKYFHFIKTNWILMMGEFTNGGKYFIDSYRNGIQISSNREVVVWHNENGIHGRYVYGASTGDWQLYDVITLPGAVMEPGKMSYYAMIV